jgi:hypothetical protein
MEQDDFDLDLDVSDILRSFIGRVTREELE